MASLSRLCSRGGERGAGRSAAQESGRDGKRGERRRERKEGARGVWVEGVAVWIHSSPRSTSRREYSYDPTSAPTVSCLDSYSLLYSRVE
eukprot:scaffold284130_cov36-Tisochrysis_lutea.AAC.3